MSTSSQPPEEVPAAEVHREAGPDGRGAAMEAAPVSSDAATAAFLEKVERAVAARVDARLAGLGQHLPARPRKRRTLVKGIAIGACAGALAVGLAAGMGTSSSAAHGRAVVAPCAGCQVKAPVPVLQPPKANIKVHVPVKANKSG